MADEEEVVVQKSNSKMIIIIAAVTVNVAILAVVLAVFSGSSSADEEKSSAEEADKEKATNNGPGPLVEFSGFIVNIETDDGMSMYLKTGLTIELADEEAKTKFETYRALVRNEVLMHLSSLTLEQTKSVKQKRAIEATLKKLINKRVGSKIVNGAYFTEFVTQ